MMAFQKYTNIYKVVENNKLFEKGDKPTVY